MSDKPETVSSADRALFVLLLALVIALELSCACWAVWPLVVGGAR
jgi:hypothetical protein